MLKTWKLRIAGKEIATPNCRDIVDPYDNRVVARVCQAGEAEYEATVQAAQAASMPTYSQKI